MKVMVFVKATADSETGIMPELKLFEDMGKFNQQLIDAGVLVTADGLKPSSAGARVKFNGTDRSVVNGPFGGKPEDLVAGFWIWEVKDMDEAIEWVKRCPNPMPSESEIEIRPFFSPEDFAEIMRQLS